MKVKIISIIIGVGLCFVLLSNLVHEKQSHPIKLETVPFVEENIETIENPNRPMKKWLPCNFYEEARFQKSVAQAKPYANEGKMKVGIIPHHLLASVQIASFFQTAAKDSYDTIVMLSTTHFAKTTGFITTTTDWKTPFGVLEQDTDLVNQLFTRKLLDVISDGEAMAADHGNAGLMPYVKYYLPKTKVVNLMVSPNLSVQKEDMMVSMLLSMSGQKKILVIGSIDFSHYLSPTVAKRMDQETEQAVEAFRLGAINQFGDEHLDSPKCMRFLLKYLEQLNIHEINRLDHLSSDSLIPVAENHPIFMEGTTTYFIYSGNEN